MNTIWMFSINQDDEQLLNQAKKDIGLSADYLTSTGGGFNVPLLTVWCEDDEAGCALLHHFLELRGDIGGSLNGGVEGGIRRRLREVL